MRKRAKGDMEKVLIAARLREETPVTLQWLAEHLAAGSAGNVTNRLWHLKRTQA